MLVLMQGMRGPKLALIHAMGQCLCCFDLASAMLLRLVLLDTLWRPARPPALARHAGSRCARRRRSTR